MKEIEQVMLELAQLQKETAQLQRETAQLQRETAHSQTELSESQKELSESQKELSESQKELSESQKELSESQKELSESQKEFSESQKELSESQKETDLQIGRLEKQLGELGNKFGSFTEGLALPSMTKILSRDFQMAVIAPRVRSRRNGHSMELDVFAYSQDPEGDAVVVEVKSHLKEEGLEQLRQILRDFREFFPEHAHRKVYGILAAVDVPDNLRAQVLREGIYLARIHDGQFELQVPEGFQPHAF